MLVILKLELNHNSLAQNIHIPCFTMSLLQRRRQIEAINGTWAMLGLTAGLVVEGQTGNSILAQVCLLRDMLSR